MNDLISRQAAIDAFEKFIHELGIEDEPYNYGEMALSVKNVPSVTPKQEPCSDAISRQAVDEAIYDYSRSCDVNYAQIMEYIDKIPSVNPQPKTGHWKRISMDKYTTHAQYWYECNKCGEHNLGDTNFCPNCGTKMVELQESEA